MDELGLAIHAEMGLHAKILLITILRLIHLRIPLLLTILRRTRGSNDGDLYTGSPADLQALLCQKPFPAGRLPIRLKIRIHKGLLHGGPPSYR